MSKELTGANTWRATITSPANGDKRSAQSVEVGLQDLADSAVHLDNSRLRRVYHRTVGTTVISMAGAVISVVITAAVGDVLLCHGQVVGTLSTPGEIGIYSGSLGWIGQSEMGATTAKQNCSTIGAFIVVTSPNPTIDLRVGDVGTVNSASLMIQVYGPNVGEDGF